MVAGEGGAGLGGHALVVNDELGFHGVFLGLVVQTDSG